MNTFHLWAIKDLTLSLGMMSGDRQKTTELKYSVNVPMQSALPDNGISKLSPTDDTADKKTMSSKSDKSSDPSPGNNQSKTRGRSGS